MFGTCSSTLYLLRWPVRGTPAFCPQLQMDSVCTSALPDTISHHNKASNNGVSVCEQCWQIYTNPHSIGLLSVWHPPIFQLLILLGAIAIISGFSMDTMLWMSCVYGQHMRNQLKKQVCTNNQCLSMFTRVAIASLTTALDTLNKLLNPGYTVAPLLQTHYNLVTKMYKELP